MLLTILAGFVFIYQAGVFASGEGAEMSRTLRENYDYKETRNSGYQIQPDQAVNWVRAEFWVRECGNAHHKCVSGISRSIYRGNLPPEYENPNSGMFREHR